MKRYLLLFLTLILLTVCLSGCVPGDGTNSPENIAGLLSEIWHGWIAPFSLIASLFNNKIGIYETYNNGFFYNLGYYAAIISGFGGLSFFRKKHSNNGD